MVLTFKHKPKLLLFLFLILFFACGKHDETIDKIQALSSEGKELLTQGDYQNARKKFEEILNLAPENCDGIYGMFLSELMIFLEKTFNSVGSAGAFIPMANEIDTIAGSLLETILNDLTKIEKYVSLAEANNCSFELSRLPVSFLNIEFRGEWDINEAGLIGGVLDLLEGILEFLLSLDFSVDTASILTAINTGDINLSMDDIVGTLRSLGIIIETSPDFLKWNPDVKRREFFDTSASDFSSLFRRLNIFLDIFTEQDSNPRDDIIAWVDEDGDGAVSSGDQLILNIYDIKTGEALVDLSSYTSLLLPLVGSLLNDWKTKLKRVEDAFAFRLPPGERISLNDVLLGFGNMLGVPNVFEFDILAFYKGSDYSGSSVKPLRELLPYIYDHDADPSTPSVMLVEGETYSPPPAGTGSYLFQGDSGHFNVGIDWNPGDSSIDHVTGEIRRDCTVPAEKGIQIGTDDNGTPIYLPLLYFAFPDPSFNGTVYTDSGGSCGDASGFNRANVYSINKAINRLILGLTTLLSAGVGIPF